MAYNAADFYRQDGKPVVEPVSINLPMGTYKDGSSTQVFPKQVGPGTNDQVLKDILAGVNQIKKHFVA